jgi:hypothetical protein
MRGFIMFTLHKYNQNDQVKEDETGSACSMHGGEKERIQGSGEKTRRKETTTKILI